jgi:hypothetical protein
MGGQIILVCCPSNVPQQFGKFLTLGHCPATFSRVSWLGMALPLEVKLINCLTDFLYKER